MTSQPSDRLGQRAAKLIPAIPFVLIVFEVGFLVWGGFSHYHDDIEKGSVWLAFALFSIPLLVQAVALFFLWIRQVNRSYYFFNLFVTAACIGVCCFLWGFYFNHESYSGISFQIVSYSILLVIFAILICVAVMTYAVMRPSSDHFGGAFCSQLNRGVRAHPFWAITFFFTLFVGVAYLFGFSLGFHNKYSVARVQKDDPKKKLRPALRMNNFESVDDWKDGETIPVAEGQVPKPQEIISPFHFYFRSAKAHLEKKDNKCDADAPPSRQWNRDVSEPERNEKSNDCNIKWIVNKIREVANNGEGIRITLLGHGDSESLGDPSRTQDKPKPKPVLHYLSNYELSRARAENVKFEILQAFPHPDEWRNIEWLILPASNEDISDIPEGLINQKLFKSNELEEQGFNHEEIAKGIPPKNLAQNFGYARLYETLGSARIAEENRVVLATMKPLSNHVAALAMDGITQGSKARPLGLIDYLYFSIYTITTTGYGDIVPTTAYAKFVTSVANFCEVLFLVVFFNSLISLRGDPQEPSEAYGQSPINHPPDGTEAMDADADGRQRVLQGQFRAG
jgi:hypothetical protein